MITNTLLRLAGVPEIEKNPITEAQNPQKDPSTINTIKHVLITAIKYYTKEMIDATTSNLKHEYKSIADKIDDILGAVKAGTYKEARKGWSSLENQVKQHIIKDILPNDDSGVFNTYFGLAESIDDSIDDETLLEYAKDPHDRAVSKDLHRIELLVQKLAHHQAADMGDGHEHDKNDVKVAQLILKLEQLLSHLKKAQHHDEINDTRSTEDITSDQHQSEYEIEKQEGDESVLHHSMHEAVDAYAAGFKHGKLGHKQASRYAQYSRADVAEYERGFKAGQADNQKNDPFRKKTNEGVQIDEASQTIPIYVDDYYDDKAAEIEKEQNDEGERVKVPAEITGDLKKAIKDIETEQKYTNHISSDEQRSQEDYLIETLNKLLDYLTCGHDESLIKAGVLLTSLPSWVRAQIPTSIWRFLSIDLYPMTGTSLKDRFKEVKLK